MFTLDKTAVEWEKQDIEKGFDQWGFDLVDPDNEDTIGVLLTTPGNDAPWSYQVNYDAWVDGVDGTYEYADGISDERDKAEAAIFAIIEHLISLQGTDAEIDINAEEVQRVGHDKTGILQFKVEIFGYGHFKSVRSHPDGVEHHWIADSQDMTGTEQEVREFLVAKLERQRDGLSSQTKH
jgi:hypothetical protein